jgi:hypothetical protein
MMLPYGASFGAAFGYEPLGDVFCIAAGAYLSAKKAGMAFVSKAFNKSLGDVEVMDAGPRRPVLDVQISNLPHEFKTSSMRASVSSSEEILYG